MIYKKKAAVQLSESLFWLGMGENPDFLQINVYMLYRNGKAIIIDPGPLTGFKEVAAAADSITEIESIEAIVVSHQDPDVCSSLPQWENKGFRGTIITHWRTGILLKAYGLQSPLFNIKEIDTGVLDQFLSLRFLSFPHLHSPGNILTFDESSRILFSSDLFGALGMNAQLYADRDYINRMVYFHKNFMSSTGRLHDAMDRIADFFPAMICPHHGSVITAEIASFISALKSVRCEITLETGESGVPDHDEMTQLKNINFELQENLILNSDEQIKDPVTGLYNSQYFESFFPVFSKNNQKGHISYFRLDQMKDFNNDFGYQEGDRAIATFSRILQEKKQDDCVLLREVGPILILMQPDAYSDDPFQLLSNLQKEIRDTDDFIRDMTCSIAIVAVSELGQDVQNQFKELLSLIRIRVKTLDRMGPDSIADSSAVGEDPENRKVVLIIDSDPLASQLIAEYLVARDYAPVICPDGNGAMHQIDLNRPDAIISEINVPQLDGFRIREQLMNSSDLRDIPFLFISHQKTESSVKRAQKMEVSHYLKKPVMLAEVYGILNILTEQRNER
jgi:diguanylate cyclase (GGDEF)-like protein